MSALHVVVMGVAGCGKSEIGERIANALHLPRSIRRRTSRR
jgi:shikimate kinase